MSPIFMLKTTRTPETICPTCGNVNDAATCVEGEHSPSPGDVSVCLYCAAILIFTDELETRLPTEREMIDLQTSQNWPTIQKTIYMIRHINPK